MKLNKVLVFATFLSTFVCPQVVKANDSAVASATVSEETESEPSFDGLMVGLGVGLDNTKYKMKGKGTYSDLSFSKSFNLFNGVLWLGYGHTFGNLYVGLIANCDFGSSKSKQESIFIRFRYGSIEDKAFKETIDKFEHDVSEDAIIITERNFKMKQKSFSPAIALRLGYIPSLCPNFMFYVDFGGIRKSVDLMGGTSRLGVLNRQPHRLSSPILLEKGSANSIRPFIRLGIQKQIYNGLGIDLNAEYRIKKKYSEEEGKTEAFGGFSIRLSCIYNCN